MEYRYQAIVLKKRKVGETDRLYTFFTREAGKITTVAKGVRKNGAKLAAALETTFQVDIIVVRTRGLGKVAGASLESSWPALHQNFLALQLVLESLSLLDRLVEPEDKDETLYGLILLYLGIMETLVQTKRTDLLGLITEAFLFQLCFHLGYSLQLQVSTVSGLPLVAGERYALSLSRGGVLHLDEREQGDNVIILSKETIKLLRLFGQCSLSQITKVIVSETTRVELTRFRKLFLAWIRH